MRTKKLLLNFLLVSIAILAQGCVVAAVGLGAAGTIAYVSGDLESVEAKNIDVVYSASLEAAKELQLAVLSKSKDALTATITARDAEDKKVQIKMKAESELTTKISIRVGTLGDETKSQRIYQKIYNNLYPIK